MESSRKCRAKEIKSRRRRLDCHSNRLGTGSHCRDFYRDRLRKPRSTYQPAVTLAVAITSHNWTNVVPFWIAQILALSLAGCWSGSHFCWHWKEPLTRRQNRNLCTAPAIRRLPANALTEIIATTTLVGVGFAFTASAVAPNGLPPGSCSISLGLLVWALGLSLGGPQEYADESCARFRPALAHFFMPITGKGKSDWGYALIR